LSYTLPTSAASTSGQQSAMVNDGSGNLSWSNIGQIKFARKTAYQDYTSTALTSDSHLSIALDTSATYTFDAFLSFTDESANGTDGKLAFSVPGGSTLKFGWDDAQNSNPGNSTVVNTSGTATAVALGIENNNSTYETFVHVKGIVLTGTTSGSLLLKCERVGGTTLRLQANSYLTVTRVQ
ncbi:MAG TPA: hypothetical protein VFH95_01005, partial [Candidatus Kapabacteria bacterium]|nr:hypothetical protein [Candidatus Kapabacteria bacterium]